MTVAVQTDSALTRDIEHTITRKPFLKWAGNKTRVRGHILHLLPTKAIRLVEPFAGSCAISLAADYDDYLIADTNTDLIRLYQQIKTDVDTVIANIETLFVPSNNTAERYYKIREEFNDIDTDDARKSAIFVYLNRHCFNGLCRYNASGKFNVPFGKYDRPVAPVKEIEVFAVFSKKAKFIEKSFEQTFEMVREGDTVYCDPPYLQLSETSNFTSYGKDGFVDTLQTKLVELAQDAVAKKGVTVLISNHDTPDAKALYAGATEIKRFEVRRFISGTVENRINAPELLAIYRPV